MNARRFVPTSGRSVIAVAFAVAAMFAGAEAGAGEFVVTQKDKAFSEKKVKLRAGDIIKFVNADSITHNVHSRSKSNKFDLGAQKPNTEITQAFTKPGKVKIRCAIHPKMKLTVVVE